MAKPLRWTSVARTHQGNVRSLNEDGFLDAPDKALWAVADGMGGHTAGDVASQMVVQHLDQVSPRSHLSDIVDAVEDAVLESNRQILTHSASQYAGAAMGSTLVSLVIHGSVGVVLWAGDSRLYRWRQGVLEQMTQDHSRVGEMVAAGAMSQDEADRHPASNIITRAVGVDPDLVVDVNLFSVKHNDVFLLCSDGLYGELDSMAIMRHLRAKHSLDQVADDLLQACLQQAAKDNVTLILVKAQ